MTPNEAGPTPEAAMTRRPHLPRRRRRGAAMVEASIGLIVLLAVIFAIIEFAQVIMARQIMTNAAQTVARIAVAGRQPATYPDRSATPAPGGVVTTAFLTAWVNNSMAFATAPVSAVNPQFYGSNADGSPNTSIAWDSTAFGSGFYVDIQGTYVPLFSGNRLIADNNGNKTPMVGTLPLRAKVFVRAEANN